MYQVKNIKIPDSVLENWDARFLPPFDYFYFKDTASALKHLSEDILITTRKELSTNPLLNTLDTLTAFSPWRVSQEAQFVAIVPNEYFNKLDSKKKRGILTEQYELGRGQLWERSWIDSISTQLKIKDFESMTTVLDNFTYLLKSEEIVVFNREMWGLLPRELRYLILVKIAELYIDNQSVWGDLPLEHQSKIKEEHSHIADYIDTFPNTNGANCFATALAGGSKSKTLSHWTISQWIQHEALALGLEQKGYELFKKTTNLHESIIRTGDILAWSNEDNIFVHTTYSLGDGLVFNKDGQTMFNPWQVLKLKDVLRTWEGTISIYRKRM
jgi:hypothetical protein